MKELYKLIDDLSKEKDLEKRKEMHIQINILRSHLNSQMKTDSVQKIYNTYNGKSL